MGLPISDISLNFVTNIDISDISLFVSDMSDVYHPPERVAGESHCRGMQKYQEMYQESIDDPTRLYTFSLFSLKM